MLTEVAFFKTEVILSSQINVGHLSGSPERNPFNLSIVTFSSLRSYTEQ